MQQRTRHHHEVHALGERDWRIRVHAIRHRLLQLIHVPEHVVRDVQVRRHTHIETHVERLRVRTVANQVQLDVLLLRQQDVASDVDETRLHEPVEVPTCTVAHHVLEVNVRFPARRVRRQTVRVVHRRPLGVVLVQTARPVRLAECATRTRAITRRTTHDRIPTLLLRTVHDVARVQNHLCHTRHVGIVVRLVHTHAVRVVRLRVLHEHRRRRVRLAEQVAIVHRRQHVALVIARHAQNLELLRSIVLVVVASHQHHLVDVLEAVVVVRELKIHGQVGVTPRGSSRVVERVGRSELRTRRVFAVRCRATIGSLHTLARQQRRVHVERDARVETLRPVQLHSQHVLAIL